MTGIRDVDEVSGAVVDCAYHIHKELGPGLLESVYEAVLAKRLEQLGFVVERQKPISFEFDGLTFEEGFRVDLLVESMVVVELKSVERMSRVYPKQLLTYLKLLNLRVGLLINFGASTMKEGLERVVNHHVPSASSPLRVNRRELNQ